MRVLYSLFFYLLMPVILLRLWWRGRLAPAYRLRWRERFGFFPALSVAGDKKVIWLHTVSVGEFLAALPLIRQLLNNPQLHLVITTTTPTGSERVQATFYRAGQWQHNVSHVYAPYDLPCAVARFLARVRPQLLLVMETELWPNTLAACAARQIPSVLINGRLSEKSARGYRRFAALTRPMLQHLHVAAIQQQADAERFIALGLPAARATVTGNIKFDIQLNPALVAEAAELKQQWSQQGARLVWIAASTHAGEDEIILQALQRLRAAPCELAQRLLLVLVPRHPERFDKVAALCQAQGYSVVRRGSGASPKAADIVLGDTMGELLLLFGASDIAFVGGSLVSNGGHNMMEPAAWRLPLQAGPHLFNFAEAARLLVDAGALVISETPAQLANDVQALCENPQTRGLRGSAALAVIESNRGALAKTLQLIEEVYGEK